MTICIIEPTFKPSTSNTVADHGQPGQRYRHQLPGKNGLGAASKFAKEIHSVAPWLRGRRWL